MTRSPYLQVGYFAQHQLEQLDAGASALEHLHRIDPRLNERGAREYLAAYHFRGERVFEAVGPFSGGEKARLALCLVVYRKPNLLLLDEPTNHLDLDLRHALEIALQDYPGALLLVSHDRHLIESTCDTLWRVAGGTVAPFDGDLEDYARSLAEREREYQPDTPAPSRLPRPSPKDQRRLAAEQRAQEKALRDSVRSAEQRLEKLQTRVAAIEAALLDPTLYAPEERKRLQQLQREHKALRTELAETEEAWLAAATRLEAAER